jgi:hypothetical protein
MSRRGWSRERRLRETKDVLLAVLFFGTLIVAVMLGGVR